MTSAPSARASRAVSSPIPALPPIKTTVWPSSCGSRSDGEAVVAVSMVGSVRVVSGCDRRGAYGRDLLSERLDRRCVDVREARVSRPIPSTRGRLPVATSRRSPRSSRPSPSTSTKSSPSRWAAVACTPSTISMPSRRSTSPSASPSGAGSRASTWSAPSTSVTEPPRRRTTCASSSPAAPAPSTSSRSGTAFMPVAPFVPQTPSSSRKPGTGGIIGSAPFARTT